VRSIFEIAVLLQLGGFTKPIRTRRVFIPTCPKRRVGFGSFALLIASLFGNKAGIGLSLSSVLLRCMGKNRVECDRVEPSLIEREIFIAFFIKVDAWSAFM